MPLAALHVLRNPLVMQRVRDCRVCAEEPETSPPVSDPPGGGADGGWTSVPGMPGTGDAKNEDPTPPPLDGLMPGKGGIGGGWTSVPGMPDSPSDVNTLPDGGGGAAPVEPGGIPPPSVQSPGPGMGGGGGGMAPM